ncbi:uncharacterized protein UTRI_00520 [Ustilago trichophora]|uniref:Uncharacterized protein n=1 Tax=Ustilago trichophora TaxID=86804 RepID=A0A5C3DRH8_9BASI|nr:uncharacterized protein UTRI_00520 [Ustilago trichophora]
MTSDTLHDLDPSFQWNTSYLTQLQHIADTDEFQHDDEQSQPPVPSSLPASSSSSSVVAGASGAYDWPMLKDAIKYRIRVCLEESFGQERPLVLHPAAALIPYQEPGYSVSAVQERAAAGLMRLRPTVPGSTGQEDGDDAETSQPTSASEEEERPTPVLLETSSSPTEEDGAASQSLPPGCPTVDPETGLYQPPDVAPADTKDFYPYKRPNLTRTSIQPLSSEEITTHTRILFSMLDDFDLQPPFTIQRLAELMVDPTAHYNSAVKWISALKRCLSVTATRDAFPISPVQAPIGLTGVNGSHDEEEGGGSATDMSEVEMDRLDGLPPTRSRSSSVASNTNAEPLFSPIPFVVRDENGLLTHSQENGDQVMGQAGENGGLMEQIPDLELGGADRTQNSDSVLPPKEVVDVAPAASISTEKEEEEQVDEVMAEAADDQPVQQVSNSTPAAATSVAERQGSVAAAVEATTTSTSPSTTATATTSTEPLGIPQGQVDELDNPDQSLHALTSTTTTTTTTTTESDSAATSKDKKSPITSAEESKSVESEPETPETPASVSEQETKQNSDQDSDTLRSSKRRKSLASIHDVRE